MSRPVGLAAVVALLMVYSSALYADGTATQPIDMVSPAARAQMVARFALRNLRSCPLPLADGTYSANRFGLLPPFQVNGARGIATMTVQSVAEGARHVTVTVRWYDGAPGHVGSIKVSDTIKPGAGVSGDVNGPGVSGK